MQQAQVQNLMVQSGTGVHPTPHPPMNAHALAAFAVNGMAAPPALPPHTVPGFPPSLPSSSIAAAAAANANLFPTSLLPPHSLPSRLLGVHGGPAISAPSILPSTLSKEEHRRSIDHASGNNL